MGASSIYATTPLDGEVDDFIQPLGCDAHVPEDSFGLFGLLLDQLVPLNISEIPADLIMQFRETRRDEMRALRQDIDSLKNELSTLDAVEVSEARIRAKARELERSMANFKSSADLLKVKGWGGVSMMGIPAPVVLGKLFAIPTASTVALATTGLVLGGLFNIVSTKEKLTELKNSSPASAFLDIRRTFARYTAQRGGGDINFHAYNCMEEYVND